MRNLELKARYADLARGEQIAQSIGATFGGDLHQLDTYFYVPHGRLKLREITPLPPRGGGVGGGELIFYQRPEDAPTRWSDYFTAPVSPTESMRDVLTRALGVRQQIEKTRRLYLYRGARIHLDRVTHVGNFIEFEVPISPPPQPLSQFGRGVGGEGDEMQARALMRELMQAFGLNDTDAITASYSELLEETSNERRSSGD